MVSEIRPRRDFGVVFALWDALCNGPSENYGSVLVSWCAKNRHILTTPEHLLTAPEYL